MAGSLAVLLRLTIHRASRWRAAPPVIRELDRQGLRLIGIGTCGR
ncbi:MAG: hypothetical protein ACRDTG_04500 [Pseudonocardiaceae bacterium]